MSCCDKPKQQKPPSDAIKTLTPSCCETANSNQPDSKQKLKIDWLFVSSGSIVLVLLSLELLFPRQLQSIGWLKTMAMSASQLLGQIWWGVLIGALFIGLLSKIPREFILSILGKGGTFTGLLRATGAGVLLDLCSHGILMVGAKLYQRGASSGQVIAFLLASPWNSFSLTLILIGLIGFYWTLAFIVLSMVIAIISGYIFDQLVKNKTLPNNPNQIHLTEDFDFWEQAKLQLKATNFDWQFFKSMGISGIKDSKMVVRWLLFGIVLASILRALLDPSQFEAYFGATLIGLAITLVFATILEVCSEGSAPIASDIFNQAKSPGNSFAFLMAGVATDYTEIMVLKETTKSLKLALFLPLISLPQVILVALFLNGFLI